MDRFRHIFEVYRAAHSAVPSRRRLLVRATMTLGLVLLGAPVGAQAATLTVTSTADPASANCTPSSCTLRAAIALANSDGANDTIELPAGTYQLTSAGGGALTITASMTIAGADARTTTILPAPSSQIFTIEGGNVALDDLTLTGASVAAEGGAAEVSGSAALTLVRDTLRNNDVEVGGIHDGGAIADSSSGQLLIESSTLSGNTGYNGGAIYTSAPTTIVNSTLTGNHAGTLSSNGDAGAIDAPGKFVLKLVNDTIAGNECFNGGGCGGVWGTVTAADTIIAGNTANTGTITNCVGTFTVTGPDIEDGTECGFTTGGSKQANPKLGPLADNGGPTDTMLPAAGSPAIDSGTNATCATHDQRGGARPAPGGGPCDIGAIEVNSLADVAITGTVSPTSVLSGGGVVYTLEVTDLGPDPALGVSVQNLLPAGATLAGAITSAGRLLGHHDAPLHAWHAAERGIGDHQCLREPECPGHRDRHRERERPRDRSRAGEQPDVDRLHRASSDHARPAAADAHGRVADTHDLARRQPARDAQPEETQTAARRHDLRLQPQHGGAGQLRFHAVAPGAQRQRQVRRPDEEEPPPARLQAHRHPGHALARRPQRREQGLLPGPPLALAEAATGALHVVDHRNELRR